MLLTGKNIYKLDAKNRFSAPRCFFSRGRKFVFTLGLDGCLFLYPEKEWKKIQGKISLFSYSRAGNRNFLRAFFAWSGKVSADSHNRVLIPSQLRKKAGIKKTILLIEIAGWYEIWDPAKFKAYEKTNRGSYENLAGSMEIKL